MEQKRKKYNGNAMSIRQCQDDTSGTIAAKLYFRHQEGAFNTPWTDTKNNQH